MSSSEKKIGAKGATAEEELLLPVETLLAAGVHIGTRIKTKDMEEFVFQVRPDGLPILDLQKFNERIKIAAKFIARFEPREVVVVSSRLYGTTPVTRFCELTGSTPIVGRFLPGLFSNPKYLGDLSPSLLIAVDPFADRQAITEASSIGIPIIALCDTDNTFSRIDFAIPSNNKGRKSLALIYWLLAREVLRERDKLPPDGNLPVTAEEFETKVTEKA